MSAKSAAQEGVCFLTHTHVQRTVMKFTSTVSKKSPSPGFALIATISVMVLMVMIALAMLSLSTIELRQSQSGKHQQEAQANARMALMIAIGELQKHAGPDTRVTANASLANASSPNPYWVGVYKTRQDEDLFASTPESGNFAVDHHEDKLYLTDTRVTESGEYKRPEPLAHLVSGEAQFSPDTSLPNDQSIVLLDTGDTASSVRVPLVKVNQSSRYAYWVSDNSVKVRYNQSNPYSKDGNSDPSASNEEYYSASVSQSPSLDDLQIDGAKKWASHSSLDSELLEKGMTIDTARLLFSDLNKQDIKHAYHLVSSDSAAVFSNPIHGGLKRDLTAFIESGDMSPVAEDQNKNLPDLLTDTPIIKGEHHNMTSPRFGILKDWADMRFKMSSPSGAASIAPQVSSDSFRQGFSQSLSLKRRDLTQVKTNYLQPIVVESSLGWDFSPYSTGSGEKLRTHLFPRLTLWNPYNVTLKARKYVMLTNIPFTGGFSYRNVGLAGFRFPDSLGMTKGNLGNPGWSFPGFVTVSVALAPGECKVFSPDMSQSGGASLAGRARKFDSLNLNNNVLSPDKAPGSDNFYWDSNYELASATTESAKNAPYGFSGNLNAFYGNYELASDEYMVLQSTSGISGSVTVKDLESDDKYETVSHFLAQNNSEKRYSKWYAAENSKNPVNGVLDFRDITKWGSDRLPPRLWRRGIRLQWFDESAEERAIPKYYPKNACRLAMPLVATTNLHGGILNHPSPLGLRVQKGWQMPNLYSHLYFRQPTDPDELKSFFPPSPIGRPSDGYPTNIVLFDLPRRDPGIFSLGQFQSAQFSYFAWHPSYILGSSYSTHQADLDATALRDRSNQTGSGPAFLVTDGNRWHGTTQTSEYNWAAGRVHNSDNVVQRATSDSPSSKKHGDEVLIYDIAYELNHAIWDSYMLSSIPYQGGLNGRTADWDGQSPLPISHYSPRPTSRLSLSEVVDEMTASPPFGFYHSAEFLLNQGALNVNCDNKEVWKAYLLSLKDKNHPNLDGSSTAGSGTSSITRSLLPGEGGSTSVGASTDDKAWNGFRALTDAEIDRLAGEIVKQVRERGPFLSMSDFINRRLNKSDTQNYAGVMQTAIDDAGINANLEQTGGKFDADQTNEIAADLTTIKNRVDYKTALLPGYFSQNDLVTVLTPSLTARGDTFTIRAYGEARNASGAKVLARAYCEAVVQRVPEYLDASDDAVEPVRIYDEASNTWTVNVSSGGDRGLSETNLQFGRQFKIKKFRWLSPNEI